MAQVAMDNFLEGTEIVRVYLAAGLMEARRVETTLDLAGISYGVELEALVGSDGLGLRQEHPAAGFWVDLAVVKTAYEALLKAELVSGLVRL